MLGCPGARSEVGFLSASEPRGMRQYLKSTLAPPHSSQLGVGATRNLKVLGPNKPLCKVWCSAGCVALRKWGVLVTLGLRNLFDAAYWDRSGHRSV